MTGEVWQIGKVKITRVVEIEATGGMSRIIPDAEREALRGIDWLYPHFVDENGRICGIITESDIFRMVVRHQWNRD